MQIANTHLTAVITRADAPSHALTMPRVVRMALQDAREREETALALTIRADDAPAAEAICVEMRRFAAQGTGALRALELRAATDSTFAALEHAAHTLFAPALKRAALVIDLQNGFIDDQTRHIPARIAALLDDHAFELVVFTRYFNYENSPFEALLGYNGMHSGNSTEIVAELLPYAARGIVIDKTGYTGLTDSVLDRLRAAALDEVVIVGLETDACVLKTAFDAFEANLNLMLISDLCATMAGAAMHESALALLARNVGVHRVITRAQFDTRTHSEG